MLDSFLYQYAVEGLIFGIGIFAGIKTGVLSPASQRGRRRLVLLSAGFLAIMALQGSLMDWGT